MQVENSSTPWYKQAWPWILIALPGSVVIASISTYFLAVKGLDPVITTDYYKEGLAINTDLTLDKRAADLGLLADVTLDGQTVILKLSAKDKSTIDALARQPIKFELENLSFQAANLNSLLMPVEAGEWRGQLVGKVSQASWTARLIGPDWRITQRVENVVPTHLALKP